MKGSYIEIIGLNAIIVGTVFVVDGNRLMRNQKTQTIECSSLENIQPEQQHLLIEDLRKRTGLDIQKISIEHIDLGKGKVVLKIYYY